MTKRVEMIHLELFPDRDVNNKSVHNLFRSLSSFHASPLDVWRGKKTPGALWWDIWMTRDRIRFILSIPAAWQKEIRLHLESIWPLCAIEEVRMPASIIPESAEVCELKYRRSNLFALQTDRRLEYEPLRSILSITGEMEQVDAARLSICAVPISRLEWQDWAEARFKEFKNGKTPKRVRINKKDALIGVGEFVSDTLQTMQDIAQLAAGGEETKKSKREDDLEKRMIMIDGALSRGTINKLKAPTFNTYIRIAAFSPDPQRQKIITRAVSNSFNELTADNELEREEVHSRLKPIVVKELNQYTISAFSKLDWDKNKMSNEELGRLMELPTAYLQDEYEGLIDSLDTRQIEVPAMLRKDGLQLGTVAYKKQEVEVYQPTNDWDQLCLPSCVVGGMGSGKTKGFACNRGAGFVRSGFSAFIFDVAKSEVWEQIKEALPPEKRQRIVLGETPISLDFSEVRHSPGARGRLAQIILSFFEDQTDSAGAQTQRFLRAAVMGMQSGELSEIVKILRDKTHREAVIKQLPAESLSKESLIEFGSYSSDRQRQILAPILNRLDVILGDPYLDACMRSKNRLDMAELLSKRGMCTVFDLPDRLNSRQAKDILINLLSFKIDIAMPFRKDEFPLAIIYDEPHQYLRSAKLWENVAVESRKYRISYSWMFHSWEQIPNSLAQIIKDANPHYFIYPSSEETYHKLVRLLQPYSLDDCLKTKRWHAICSLVSGMNNRLPALMIRMTPPPKPD